MAKRRQPRIVDADNEVGHLRGVRVGADQRVVAIVGLDGQRTAEVPFELLHHDGDDGYGLQGRWGDFPVESEHGVVLPMIREVVRAEVREREPRRVRVRRRVVTETRVVETPVWRERIAVERRPLDVCVASPPEPRWEGDTLVVPCTEEVAVVETRYRIREELRIRVVRERHLDRQDVTVRHHEIDIERSHPTDKPEGDDS